MRSARPGCCARNSSMAAVGVSTSVRYVKSTSSTSCSGLRSARSRHSGWPSRLARRSQAALTIAATARWMAPFSGPIQRSCESPVRRRAKGAEAAPELLDVEAEHERGEHVDRATDDLGAATDGERQTVPLAGRIVRVGSVGAEHDVRGRVVRIGVHRVGAVERIGGGEPDVEDVDRRIESPDASHGPDRRRGISQPA